MEYLLFCWLLASVMMFRVHAQCPTSGIGFALEGYSYSNFTAPDVHTCYTTCKLQEPECRSINYNVNTSLCQLNNRSRLSRPANYIASSFSLYFHSEHRGTNYPRTQLHGLARTNSNGHNQFYPCIYNASNKSNSCFMFGINVRLGSAPAVAAESCKEILDNEESRGDGRYWVKPLDQGNGTGEPYNTYCDMSGGGAATFSFDLIFPERSTKNYVLPAIAVPSLNAFTVCFWVKTDVKDWIPFSYAVGSHSNAIMMFFDHTGLLRFHVLDEQVTASVVPLDDNKWHHVCGTWEQVKGTVNFYVDGLQNISSTGIAVGSTVQGGGYFILGQDQDFPNGGFDIKQTFVGEISHFYLWPSALTETIIQAMARVCKEKPHTGHVLSWADFSVLHGDVQRRNQSASMSHEDILSVYGEPREL